MNNTKTFILLAALTALLLVLGHLIAGKTGVIIALIMALAMNFSAYWYSDQMVLRSFQAQPLTHDHRVYQIIQMLSQRANIPMPKVYLINTPTPNAFATGRNPEHAAVAVTSGILSILSDEELTGVLAHEMSHITHRDTLISTVAATLSGAISSIANLFMWGALSSQNQEGHRTNPIAATLMVLLAPMAAGLVQMAVSRSREYDADAAGAKLCQHPLWLASALAKLEKGNQRGQFRAADEHPNTAHMFTVNPLSPVKLNELFATHPLTMERIKRLQEMAGNPNFLP